MESTYDDNGMPDPDFPSLPKRLLWVFVSPGKLADELADNPKWFMALLATSALIALGVLLIPMDVFLEFQRLQALERGAEFPEIPERWLNVMRWVVPLSTVIWTLLVSFIFAGLYTIIFAFVLGDEGRFVQYLAVLAHAWFIAAVLGLVITPLRISTGNPQFTVNLASLLLFLPDGYLLNVFRVLDVSQIWSTLVFAQGVHAIDSRRSFGSATAICMGVLVAFAMAVAPFM